MPSSTGFHLPPALCKIKSNLFLVHRLSILLSEACRNHNAGFGFCQEDFLSMVSQFSSTHSAPGPQGIAFMSFFSLLFRQRNFHLFLQKRKERRRQKHMDKGRSKAPQEDKGRAALPLFLEPQIVKNLPAVFPKTLLPWLHGIGRFAAFFICCKSSFCKNKGQAFFLILHFPAPFPSSFLFPSRRWG